MVKKCIIFILMGMIITVTALAGEDIKPQANIGYKYYTSKSPVYYYLSSFEDKSGDIFVDFEDNLYVVNGEGTFIYNMLGELTKHMNERIQIPIKVDGSGNIYITQKNKIKKLSPQKDLITSFSLDSDARLIHIDDKGSYYFIYTRKEFKAEENNDEINKIDNEISELSKPIELSDSGEIDVIEKRLLDYRDERRDSTWALKEVKVEYNNFWKEYEFETTSKAKVKKKAEVDKAFNQIKKLQDRLKFIDEDVDDLNDRIKVINKDRKSRIKDKQRENKSEIRRLIGEKEKLLKDTKEDKKLKYEIRVYTSDKYLVESYPIPLTSEGIPLFSSNKIVSDRSGNYYGTDGKSVYIYDWEGILLASFGNYGDHHGGIKSVSQLAVDSKRNIYVVDSAENKILKFGLTKPVLNSIH